MTIQLFLHMGEGDWFQDMLRLPKSEDAQVPWSAHNLLGHIHGSFAKESTNLRLCIKFAIPGSLNPGMKNQRI